MEKENDEKIFHQKNDWQAKTKIFSICLADWKKIFLARIEQKMCKIPRWTKVRDKKIFLKFDNFFICSTMKKTKNL